jgi:hypothetical protein
MPPQLPSTGVAWYVGAPQTGKTTLAVRHAGALVTSTGRPLLVLDWGGVNNFRDSYHVRTPEAAIEELYGEGEHCFYTPASREDADRLLAAVLEAGETNVLVDEAHYMLGRHGTSKPLLRMMRAHAHVGVFVLCTSQHYTGDVTSEARSCSPIMHVFRTTAELSLDLLRKSYDLEPRKLVALPTGAHYRLDLATDARELVSPDGRSVNVERRDRRATGELQPELDKGTPEVDPPSRELQGENGTPGSSTGDNPLP